MEEQHQSRMLVHQRQAEQIQNQADNEFMLKPSAAGDHAEVHGWNKFISYKFVCSTNEA